MYNPIYWVIALVLLPNARLFSQQNDIDNQQYLSYVISDSVSFASIDLDSTIHENPLFSGLPIDPLNAINSYITGEGNIAGLDQGGDISFSIEDLELYLDQEGFYQFDSLYYPGRLYHQGYQDGRLYYKNKGTFWGAYGVGIVTPFVLYFVPGLTAGGIMAAVPPNERNLRFHDLRFKNHMYSRGYETNDVHELFNDLNYTRGYKKGAHNRKVGSVAGGMAAGIGTSIAVVFLLVIAMFSAIQ